MNKYMMLGRLQSDCDYYLGLGNRNKNVLYEKDEVEQLRSMAKIWRGLKSKPLWLSRKKLETYSELMTGRSLKENGIKLPVNPLYRLRDFTRKFICRKQETEK